MARMIPNSVHRILNSDFVYDFRRSRLAVGAAVVFWTLAVLALLAPWIAPQNPYDVGMFNLEDALHPPFWIEGGEWRFPFGTDSLGRDMLSLMLYGTRLSLLIGVFGVLLALVIGVTLGLLAGYFGGVTDLIVMRIAEIQLSFPAILIALLLDGVLRSLTSGSHQDTYAIPVLIIAIAGSGWVQYARTIRASTLVETSKDYIRAARVIGRHPLAIMILHVLPNVMGPILVVGTIHIAVAIVTEATLSFLGIGVPPTEPSLGTLVRTGQDFLFSGSWWLVLFPSLSLVTLTLSVNLFGDWVRETLSPRTGL